MAEQLNNSQEVRRLLLENEERLKIAAKELSIGYSASNKISFFNDLHHDGDLIDYIRSIMSKDQMQEYSKILHGA